MFRREELARFLRFLAVGAGGFCVDAGVLMVGTQLFGFNALAVRFLSFAVAVLFTFILNRAWAFRDHTDAGFLRGFGAYLGVQGLGFATNLAVYSLLYLLILKAPLICLSIASAVALIVNYIGARAVVFRHETHSHLEL